MIDAIFQQITSLKPVPGKPFSSFIRELDRLFAKSADCGMKWDENFKKSTLLWKIRQSRPDTTMLNRLRSVTRYKDVRSWLLDDERTEKELENSSLSTAENGAYVTKRDDDQKHEKKSYVQKYDKKPFDRNFDKKSYDKNKNHERKPYYQRKMYDRKFEGENKTPYERNRCKKCHKKGHAMKYCQTKGVYCYECKRLGDHFGRDCPQRNKNPTNEKPTTRTGTANAFYSYCNENDKQGKCFYTHDTRIDCVRFIVDSAASFHFTNEKRIFEKLTRLSAPIKVLSAKRSESASIEICEKGNLHTYDEMGKPLVINSVYYSSVVSENLLSLRSFVEQGAHFVGNKNYLEIRDGKTNGIIIKAQFEPPFWVCNLKIRNTSEKLTMHKAMITNNQMTDNVKNVNDSTNLRENLGLLWHKRLRHVSLSYLEIYKTKTDELKKINFGKDILDCEACALSKIHRLPSNKTRQRSEITLQRVHSDVMGPISPISYLGKRKFIVTFVEDFSRFAMVFVMHKKSDVAECFAGMRPRKKLCLGLRARTSGFS